MIGVTILGATGSIGTSTLDVIAMHPDRYQVVAVTACRQVGRMRDICLRHRPRYAAMADPDAALALTAELKAEGCPTEVLTGVEGLETVASLPEVHQVMAAIVGAAGLGPTLAAARAGKRLLLANKEALVMSGRIFMDEVQASGAELLPIDSEHNAIFQCMPRHVDGGLAGAGVTRILLTASGGPFRDTELSRLAHVTPEQAVAHPNWSMGRKISVDSATMMNKGLEVIEACWLFDTTPDRVQVVLHPQSVIHSMVEYVDGSVLAQLGQPDMRTPIAHAMAWPERMGSGVAPVDLFQVGRLDFRPPDPERFPCLDLAVAAWRMGGTATAVLNAANEVAVEAFLEGRIPFTHIPRTIEHALERCPAHEATGLAAILDDDAAARRTAADFIGRVPAQLAQ